MRTKLTKIALTATIVLALAFTLSCSSDDDDNNNNGGGGWLTTCEQFHNLFQQCDAKYQTEYNNCTDSACEEKVDEKIDDCISAGACNGTGFVECKQHYEDMGC